MPSRLTGATWGVSGRVGPIETAAEQIQAAMEPQLAPSHVQVTVAMWLQTRGFRQWFRMPATGQLTIRWCLVPPGVQIGPGPLNPRVTVVASGEAAFRGATWGSIAIKSTKTGRRILAREPSLVLTAVATFTPRGRPPVRAMKRFRL